MVKEKHVMELLENSISLGMDMGETGEVMLETGEKEDCDSWMAFKGSIWPR